MKTQNTTLTMTLLTLGFLALSPIAQAVVPAPDGGYPNFTTAEGDNALFSLTTGAANTAVGWFSLESVTTGSFNTGVGAGTLVLNTGDDNTATGAAALLLNTTGVDNTANGTATLVNNSTGSSNTALGAFALNNNTTGTGNTASGFTALSSNTEGSTNTATGFHALNNNTIGDSNTASGSNALFSNTQGSANTANGGGALFSNTVGDSNTATGLQALGANNTGAENTANGAQALVANTTGNSNTAVGFLALAGNDIGDSNTAIGAGALLGTTGSGSIAIGFQAGAFVGSSGNVIAIGSPGDDVDNSCFIGNIRDAQTQNADAVAVVVDSAGQLGTISSSRRFKEEIKPMGKASESVLALQPVTFRYKSAKKGMPQFGLIAEEVARVNPDLVVRDKAGKPYSVRYDQVNAMLLNEFLKEYSEVQELKKQVAALTAGLQKVSAQLEVRKPAPQTVLNNQ